MMFDYITAARRLGLSDAQLDQLCKRVRSDYPDDEMLFELHVLRAIQAVESGPVSLDQVLNEPELQPPAV